MHQLDHADRPDRADAFAADAPAPGKRTLTMAMAAGRGAAAAPAPSPTTHSPIDALQLRRMMDAAVRPDLHASAAAALGGDSGPLPFLAAIQAGFGHHDVGHIRAHTDATAAAGTRAMGAEAFALGDRVAFAGAPDLHTAAHEAAHVVQQRAGVHLAGGVGAEHDQYERHADEVADLIVAGKSAEAALDRHAGAPGLVGHGGGALQCKWLRHPGSRLLRWDTLINGLRWYLDPEHDVAWFQLEGDPGPLVDRLEPLEGPSHARSIEDWARTQSELFEASTEEPEAPSRSEQSLGPTTQRGVPIPRVGFGTDIDVSANTKRQYAQQPELLRQKKESLALSTLRHAVGTGSRLFDTALSYGTLAQLGQALREHDVAPCDRFIVYKIKPVELWTVYGGDLGAAVDHVLKLLGGDQLDVLMLHDLIFPSELPVELVWPMMQKLVFCKKVRYLGLSNVTIDQLDLCTPGDCQIGVSFIQNKMHPHRQDKAMRRECKDRGLEYMGYSIMGSGSPDSGTCGKAAEFEPEYSTLDDEALKELGEHEGMTAPGLAISWAVAEGTVQIPKSSQPKNMIANRRVGRRAPSQKTVELVGGMDDLVTDESTLIEVSESGHPCKELMLLLPSRGYWKMIEQRLSTPLGDTMCALSKSLAGNELARQPLVELFKYLRWIDLGECDKEKFVPTGSRMRSGDPWLVVKAFAMGDPGVQLLRWALCAQREGGCVEACTEVMSDLANGQTPGAERQQDQPSSSSTKQLALPEVRTVAPEGELATIPLAELSECYPDPATATIDDDCLGKHQGKLIEFVVTGFKDGLVSMVITKRH